MEICLFVFLAFYFMLLQIPFAQYLFYLPFPVLSDNQVTHVMSLRLFFTGLRRCTVPIKVSDGAVTIKTAAAHRDLAHIATFASQ